MYKMKNCYIENLSNLTTFQYIEQCYGHSLQTRQIAFRQLSYKKATYFYFCHALVRERILDLICIDCKICIDCENDLILN